MTDYQYVHCTMYRLYRYSTRTLCAVCEECSVFAIHYKYIVEGLRKNHKMYKDYRSLVLKEILG